MPELPHQKLERFVHVIGLTPYEADILVNDKELADYFEQTYKHCQNKQVINWILRDVIGYLNEHKIDLHACNVTPEKLAEIINLVEQGVINGGVAKEIFLMVAQTGKQPSALVKEQGLEQIGSVEELEAIVQAIVAENPGQVEQYRSGKDKLFGFFVGQAMQKTKGKGNPVVIQDLLKKYLK